MNIVSVVLTMLLSFVSLMIVVVIAKAFGFAPSDFHNPDKILRPTTMVLSLCVLLLPIAIVLLSQKFLLKRSVKDLGLKTLWFKGVSMFASGTLIGLLSKFLATWGAIYVSPDAAYSLPASGISFQAWLPYFAWFIFALFLNSLNEELAYRAFPIQNLKASSAVKTQGLLACWAFVFASVHVVFEPFDVLHFLYRFAFGMAAGELFLERHSLWKIVGFHTGWNFLALTVADSEWREGGLIRLVGIENATGLKANTIVLWLLAGGWCILAHKRGKNHPKLS